MPPGSVLDLEHASLLCSLQLRPSVGAPAVCRGAAALRLALGAAISPQLPPPTLASFKFAPALSESELINMQNHSVTH